MIDTIGVRNSMQHYRDTSFNFLYFSILHLLYIEVFLKRNVEKNLRLELLIFELLYLLLVVSVSFPIIKRRMEIKKFQKNGRCYAGTVVKLMEISVGTAFNRFGIVYDTAYYLKVMPQGESNGSHYIYSDILRGNKGQKISKDVLIYDDYGKTFVYCNTIKTKQNYEIEQTKKEVHYSWNKKLLISLNVLFAVTDIITLLALIAVTNPH